MTKLAVGIDIGGTNSVFGFVDDVGHVHAKSSIKTAEYEHVDDYVKILSDEIRKLFTSIPDSELIGVGIGAPNGNYYKGTIEFAPNLRWKGIIPLGRHVLKRT